MKKLFSLIGLVVLVSGSVFAFDEAKFKKDRQQGGYYDGDPNQNEILEVTEDYIVIRNLTAKSQIYNPTLEMYETAEILALEAQSHCKKNNFFNISYNEGIEIDEHTIYIVCEADLGDLLKEIYNLSEKDSMKAQWLQFCTTSWGTYDEEYKKYNCHKRIKEGFKKWPKAKELANKINAHEKKFNDRSFVFDLKKEVLAKANAQQTINAQQKKMETCSAYGFEVGSEPFGQCIFKLMELELEYAKLENEAMRLQAQAKQAKLSNQAALAQSLAAQAQASNRDIGLRLQQFGLAMQGIANAFQTPSSMVNPKITCQNLGMQMKCW